MCPMLGVTYGLEQVYTYTDVFPIVVDVYIRESNDIHSITDNARRSELIFEGSTSLYWKHQRRLVSDIIS